MPELSEIKAGVNDVLTELETEGKKILQEAQQSPDQIAQKTEALRTLQTEQMEALQALFNQLSADQQKDWKTASDAAVHGEAETEEQQQQRKAGQIQGTINQLRERFASVEIDDGLLQVFAAEYTANLRSRARITAVLANDHIWDDEEFYGGKGIFEDLSEPNDKDDLIQ